MFCEHQVVEGRVGDEWQVVQLQNGQVFGGAGGCSELPYSLVGDLGPML
jgi:hypothetical protein